MVKTVVSFSVHDIAPERTFDRVEVLPRRTGFGLRFTETNLSGWDESCKRPFPNDEHRNVSKSKKVLFHLLD